MPKKMRLHVGGFDYVIYTDEDSEYMHRLTADVNERLGGLAVKHTALSATMVGILAALEFCDETKKARLDADNLRAQVKGYVEDSKRSRQEIDDLHKQIRALNKEIDRLRNADRQTSLL